MKRFVALAALILLILTACQKDELHPVKPEPKNAIFDCRSCDGNWDITDSIP